MPRRRERIGRSRIVRESEFDRDVLVRHAPGFRDHLSTPNSWPTVATKKVLNACPNAECSDDRSKGLCVGSKGQAAQCRNDDTGDHNGFHGATPSIGTVRDSCDNVLAAAVNGYYKSNLLNGPARRGHAGRPKSIEVATFGWVYWHPSVLLHGRIAELGRSSVLHNRAEHRARYNPMAQLCTRTGRFNLIVDPKC